MVAALVATAVPCGAQVVATPLDRRGVEAGFAYKWFQRDVTSGQTPEVEWEVATLYGRYGASDWLSLCAEGGLWEVGHEESARDFQRWAVGVGLCARLYQRGPWLLFANGTLNEVYDLDKSSTRSDEVTRSWTLAALVARSFGAGSYRLNVFAGPMFVADRAQVYTFDAATPVDLETDPRLGIAVGADGWVLRYVGGFAYVLYAEHPQLRLGVSVRSFGGRP